MLIGHRPRRGRRRHVSGPPRRACFLRIEPLEDRSVPSVYVVNSLADFLTAPAGTPPGTLTLRQAIEMANANVGTGVSNTIQLSVAGTYQITSVSNGATDNSSGEFAIFGANGYSLTITNTSGGRAVIDGGGLNRVFDINNGGVLAAFSVTFQDVTITDGVAGDNGGGIRAQTGPSIILDDVDLTDNSASGYGGGIYIDTGQLTINSSAIANNHADSGGGVYSKVKTIITDSFIQGNVANGSGGALFLGGIAVSVTGTSFVGNVAPDGGAIDDEANSLSLQYCTFGRNHAFGTTTIGFGGVGGSIYVSVSAPAGASLVIANCLFQSNAANYENMGAGGAIMQESGNLTLLNSQLSDNVADDLGGAINFSGTTLTISGTTIDNTRSNGEGAGLYFIGTGTGAAGSTLTNDTLTRNSAYDGGGGIDDVATGDLTLVNDTINANYGQNGGGIWLSSNGKLAIQNTIIAQNTAFNNSAGPDVLTDNNYKVTDLGGNLVGNNSGSAGFTPGALIGTAANPINPALGPLLDNGAMAPYTTFTVGGANVMYYAGGPATLQVVQTEALLTTSPAFNAGIAAGAPATDERGFSRPAANPSIGAYEPQYSSSATPSQVYVENLFEILLNRPAGSGMSFWAARVNPTGPNAPVVQAIESAPEYDQDQIALFFRRYLGRAADSSGLNYWVNYVTSGGTLAQVQAYILGSSEYANNHGGNNVAIVESLFENVLNRIPVAVEVDQWLNYLQVGGSLEGMATGFVLSQEHLIDLIVAGYQAELGRPAGPAGVGAWLGPLSASDDPQTFLNANILGSIEAFLLETVGSA
jgi:hypothetical protein